MNPHSEPSPTPDTSPETFVYRTNIIEDSRRTARNRRLGCWPFFCVLPVTLGIWIALHGGPGGWMGWCLAGVFPLGVLAFEYAFTRHAYRSAALSEGWLTYDGSVLSQHGVDGAIIASIEPRRPFRSSSWHVGGNYVVSIRQNNEHLEFTSEIDRAEHVITNILGISYPGQSMD